MISVIVPVYNSVKSLRHCVQAIENQTYPNWELILVDDGSSDGSAELCDKLAAENAGIQVIHKPNGGVSSARNAGIDAAKGEYITFCDSDDYLEPDYLENLVHTAKSNPDCGHIWCCFQTVSSDNQKNATPNYVSDKDVLFFTISDYTKLHELWLDTAPWNKLYQAGLIKEKSIRFPKDLSLGEDWLFNMRYLDAASNKKVAVITKPLYNYVRGNVASLDSKYRGDLLTIYHQLNDSYLSYLQKWDIPQSRMSSFYDSKFYMYERVLRNTMLDPTRSRHEKIKWNSQFMNTNDFKHALRARSCPVSPFYMAAYRSGSFSAILFMDWLQSAKKKLQKKRV